MVVISMLSPSYAVLVVRRITTSTLFAVMLLALVEEVTMLVVVVTLRIVRKCGRHIWFDDRTTACKGTDQEVVPRTRRRAQSEASLPPTVICRFGKREQLHV